MKTKQIALIAVSIILIIAIFTNPNQTAHKEKVKTTITSLFQKQLKENETESNNSFQALGSLLGTSLINTIVENGVSCDNYILFSITKFTYEGQEKSIGYGLLGKVFLSSKIEDAFRKKQ
ncbi:DUF4359 domain-containing protein [Flavobacterium nackdongense]|uniref:DUF4359 domain-containing protein n=1 Tax=Flavobacterium nackdongense TaxID=2547394 RepID=A0A4P6Y7W7_9FLAO|nr:DUF4359 domain-containing protein [Flavobacterium nackdongense]QBN17798.1 DUF4359 domain-containing protein [Flavobacterium nackdongense]